MRHVIIFIRMSHYWNDLYKSADRCTGKRKMYVYLYPNTKNQKPNCGAGTDVTSPLYDAAETLLNDDSISYYAIERFDVDSYSYPQVDTSSRDKIASEFENFLKNSNGTDSDLKAYRGAHVLVHGDSCSVDTAGGEPHDYCGGSYPGSAFSRGTMAWTGVCSDTGLRQNSSIQETLHQFIRAGQSDVEALLGDGDGDGDVDTYDEHTLGVIDSFGDITPLLTYHSTEFQKAGQCKRDANLPTGYAQYLTWCTVDAVGFTADDQCNPQSYCL